MEDVDGGEAGEDDPVELFEQVRVGPASNDESSVCISDEHHPPDEAEEEGVEVGRHDHVPREGEQLAPTTEVKKIGVSTSGYVDVLHYVKIVGFSCCIVQWFAWAELTSLPQYCPVM